MFRCPGKLTERAPEVRAAFWACRQYEDHGLLPSAGGLLEQTSGFVDYLHVYQQERGLIEKERQEKAKREAARAAANKRSSW